MHPNLRLQLNLRNSLQSLPQNRSLEFQLPRIRNVLVMASATLPKIRTPRLNPIAEASINCVTEPRANPGFSCRIQPQFAPPVKQTAQTPSWRGHPRQPQCEPAHRRHKSVFQWKAASSLDELQCTNPSRSDGSLFNYQYPRVCHPERSEGSAVRKNEIPRFARDDNS